MTENQKDQGTTGNQKGQQNQNQKNQPNQGGSNQQSSSKEDSDVATAEQDSEELGTSMPGRDTKSPVAGQEKNQSGKNQGSNQNSGSNPNSGSNKSGGYKSE